MRLSDAERKLMEAVWSADGSYAKDIAQKLTEQVGWKKTTTYTMITICIEKGYLRREDPHFRCYAIVPREQVVQWETDALISNDYNNRPDLLVASLVRAKKVSMEQLAQIYDTMQKSERPV